MEKIRLCTYCLDDFEDLILESIGNYLSVGILSIIASTKNRYNITNPTIQFAIILNTIVTKLDNLKQI